MKSPMQLGLNMLTGSVHGDQWQKFLPAAVNIWSHWRVLLIAFSFALLTACASKPFTPVVVDDSSFIKRAVVKEKGPLKITAAVPTAAETIALTGLDLYEQGIQPVWLKVENAGPERARILPWSMDPDYFSAIEVSYMNRKKFSKQGQVDLERWFYENGMKRHIPAGESRSGLIFTHAMPGSKGFNLDVFTPLESYTFTYFVPMPGFTADFMQVDFKDLYDPEEWQELDPSGLFRLLKNDFPCCSTDESGEKIGAPLNIALVASALAVRRSLLRAGWHETAAGSEDTLEARLQFYRGRQPDTTFQIVRENGAGTIELRLWLTSYKVKDEPVWIGQAIFLESNEPLIELFARESVTADIDSTRKFVVQRFWYYQSLRAMKDIEGVGVHTQDNPLIGHNGAEYFTDGLRAILHLSERSVAMDKTNSLVDPEEKEATDQNE